MSFFNIVSPQKRKHNDKVKNIFNNLKKVYNNFNLFIGDAHTAFWIKLHHGNKEIYKVPFGFSVNILSIKSLDP